MLAPGSLCTTSGIPPSRYSSQSVLTSSPLTARSVRVDRPSPSIETPTPAAA